MTVEPSTHLRLDVNESRTVVSVFNGVCKVVQGAETTVVAKKESLTLGADQPVMAKKITEEPFDAWDKQSNDYHQQYSQGECVCRWRKFVWAERSELLRELYQRGRMRTDVAAVPGECVVESVCEWCVGAVSGGGLLVGVAVPVGMAAVPLGIVGVLPGSMDGDGSRAVHGTG